MSFEKLAVLKNQMEVDAKAKADEAKKVANAQKVNPVVYTIARLQRLFPKAFPKSPLPKIPLKIGILKDLLARSDEIKISHDDLKVAIQKWCRSHRYWSASTEGFLIF